MHNSSSLTLAKPAGSIWLKLAFRIAAGGMVVLLTSILIFNNRQQLDEPDTVVLHGSVNTIQLPPPPPPMEVVKQQQSAPKLDVRIAGDGPSLTLSKLKTASLKPNLSLQKTKISAPQISEQSMQFDTSSFGLSDLDSLPRLLTPLQITFTPDMKRQGVKKVTVKLHVQIDTYGRVLLKAIKENPYPQLNKALASLARSAKFTPPKRHGKSVKAEFIWPLELKE